MKNSKSNSLRALLLRVLTQPTAPFRESWTRAALLRECLKNKLSFWIDPVGNLWINASSLADVRRARLVFVAHLDHPGFVVEKFQRSGKRTLVHARWLGGGPMDIRNMSVCVFSDFHAGIRLRGRVLSTTKGVRSVDRAVIELQTPQQPLSHLPRKAAPWGACLIYPEASTGAAIQRGQVITKAADDLVGACALVAAFARQAHRREGVVACLTRAEESGFHGTLEILKRGWLNPARTKMISIETSSWRLGAELGKGPVLRLGDRVSLFDHFLVEWMEAAAIKLHKKDSKFLFQKRVMDGGSCEASAFKAFGFKAAGLSTPLENYHNIVSKTGAAKAEIVRFDDVEKLTLLLSELLADYSDVRLATAQRHPLADFKKRILKNHKTHEKFF